MKKDEYIFFIILALQNLAFNFAHPVTPTLIVNLKLNPSIFGIAFSSMALTSFLSSQFWGALSFHKNESTLFMIGCFGYAFSQYLFLLSTLEVHIIIARLLGGFFIACINVSSLNYLVRISDHDKKGINLNLFATITLTCTSFGFLLGGFIGNSNISYAFISQIVLLIICGISFYFLTIKKDVTKFELKEFAYKSNPFSFLTSTKDFTKSLYFTMFLALSTTLAATSYDQSFNYYMKDIFNFNPSSNGIVKACIGIITLVSISTIGMFLDKNNINKKSLYFIFLSCTVSLLVLINVSNAIPFIIINLVFAGVNALHMPIIQNLVTSEKSSFNTLGLYNSMKSLGWILGGLAAGILYAKNPLFPFILSLFLFIICSILSYKKFNKK